MLALYILLGVVALIALLLLLPVHIRLRFNSLKPGAGLLVQVRYGPVVMTLWPRPDRPVNPRREEKRRRKEERRREKRLQAGKEQEKPSAIKEIYKDEGLGGVVDYVRSLAELGARAAGRALNAITVDRLVLEVVAAGEDAAETAIRYGRFCAAVYPAVGLLESRMRVRRRKVVVRADFLSEEGRVSGIVRLHARPGRILWIGIRFLFGYLSATAGDGDGERPEAAGPPKKRAAN